MVASQPWLQQSCQPALNKIVEEHCAIQLITVLCFALQLRKMLKRIKNEGFVELRGKPKKRKSGFDGQMSPKSDRFVDSYLDSF